MFSTSHIHPMLVHFPIALILIGFIAELGALIYKKEICLTKFGLFLLITGTLAAIFTWLSGALFTAKMEGAAGQVRETHELIALSAVILATVTSVLRIYLIRQKEEKPGLKKLAFLVYALAAICIGLTGFFGGTLVYNYMMPL